MFSSSKFTNLRRSLLQSAFLFLTILTFFPAFAQWSPTPASERLNNTAKRNLLRSESVLNDVKFRNIGPSQMSGRVVDIEVNPENPLEFYVAYATGGLWHTINNGQSLVPVFDKEDVIGIGDFAVNWKNGEIWVGTGEANSSRSVYSGIGVYKSSDKGKTWQYLGLPESHHIGKIILHPENKDIAWVAASGHLYSSNKERGVYKTIDGGKTWKQTLSVDDKTGAIDMDINPKNPDEIYACMWYRERKAWNFVGEGKTSAIYKSADGGNSWKKITGKESGFPENEKIGRIGIAICASNPQVVYAIMDNQNHRPDTAIKKTDTARYVLENFKNISKEQFLQLDPKKLNSFLTRNNFPEKYTDSSIKEMVRSGKIKAAAVYEYLTDANTRMFDTPVIGGEIYKSENGGTTWKKVNTAPLELYSSYGYYFGKISVSPVNENKVIISGIDLMVSNNGGQTFKSVDKPNTHSDWHGAWINPKNESHWIAANDGGCNITYDNGEHWFKVNTPPVGQFYAVTVDDAKPYNVYGGLQDNGVWYGSSANKSEDEFNFINDNWKNIGGGDGMQVQIDPRDNKTVYYGSQYGEYQKKQVDEKEGKKNSSDA